MNFKVQIPLSMSQTTNYCHFNFFIITLPSSEGRAGQFWHTFNKIVVFHILLHSVSHISQDFPSLHIVLLIYTLDFIIVKLFFTRSQWLCAYTEIERMFIFM
jgi:hypothetical protein